MNRERRGFTLIELLVVIGIITVLLAILIPVVSRVRISSQTAATTAEMHRISAAIGNYFNDFQAYPGMTWNQGFANGAKPFVPKSGTYTQSEDLVMALLGGLQLDPGDTTKTKIIFVSDQVGLGPISFNKVVVSPRKNAYMEKIPAELTPLQDGAMVPTNQVIDLGTDYASDSEMPEFIDAYARPRPIIYVRANPSALATNVAYNSKMQGGFNPNFVYDLAAIQPYLKTVAPYDDFHDPTARDTPGKTGFSGSNLDPSKQDANGKLWIRNYFTGGPDVNTARNAGSYLLLDAGADRVFGTDDDIIVGAGGGQ